MRILVVEDDPNIRIHVRRHLENFGYRVDETGNGAEGLYFASEYPVDAAIIDLGLPDVSGLDIIKRLRLQGSRLPILVLTARGRWQERVEGLEAGADDYLTKPFQMEELLARLKSLIRRVIGAPQSLIRCGTLLINVEQQRAFVSEVEIDLTTFEYQVLEYLAKRQGAIVSKGELRGYLYPHDADPESNVLTVLMSRLRRKLNPDGAHQLIETLHGRGYRLN